MAARRASASLPSMRGTRTPMATAFKMPAMTTLPGPALITFLTACPPASSALRSPRVTPRSVFQHTCWCCVMPVALCRLGWNMCNSAADGQMSRKPHKLQRARLGPCPQLLPHLARLGPRLPAKLAVPVSSWGPTILPALLSPLLQPCSDDLTGNNLNCNSGGADACYCAANKACLPDGTCQVCINTR